MITKLSEPGKGVLFAVIAHLFWGGMAVYFGFMRHINPMEIAVNRGVWSLPIAGAVIWYLGLGSKVWTAFKNPRLMMILALTSAIIVFNWTLYIWCIQHGRTLEASLGYFINPLLNVLAGFIFLGERFNRVQLAAIALAAVAVIVETVATGAFPFLGLSLAVSFCIYGLLRKQIAVGAVEGFFLEVLIITGPLLAVQYWLSTQGEAHFGGSALDTAMLVGCGAFTSGALIFFAASIKRLRYSTAGLLQYISPSLVFLTAVFIFHEPMDHWKFLSFALIWAALAVYSVSSLRSETTT